MSASFDMALGWILLVLAALTAGLRAYDQHHLLGWRATLQERFGETTGDVLHFVAYTVSPAILGFSFVLSAWLR